MPYLLFYLLASRADDLQPRLVYSLYSYDATTEEEFMSSLPRECSHAGGHRYVDLMNENLDLSS